MIIHHQIQQHRCSILEKWLYLTDGQEVEAFFMQHILDLRTADTIATLNRWIQEAPDELACQWRMRLPWLIHKLPWV